VKATLRDKRCLGYLKNSYDGGDYVDALGRGVEDLKTLTANIEYGDFSEEQRDLRSETMKLAHGLIGTATGIYDLLDVDVTRILRMPGRVSSDMKAGDRADLQQCLIRMATIASKMGAYTQSRVQFEPREEKREAIGKAPTVDAADPTGTHIGQWSIQGYGATDLTEDIEYALEHPGEFDLPLQVESEHYADFVVDMPIEASFTRERVAAATTRILNRRSMRPTRQAVSVMEVFTGSIHDVTKALFFKSSEDGRRVRVDDLKYALSTLPKSRICPERGSKGTKSAVLHTLIAADRPLSQRELCDRAGVATATFAGHGDKRSHRDELAAFDLIRETDSGWVICLTYRDAEFDADARRAAGRAPVLRRSRRGGELPRSRCRRRRPGGVTPRRDLRGGRRARTDGFTRRPGPPRHRRDVRDVHPSPTPGCRRRPAGVARAPQRRLRVRWRRPDRHRRGARPGNDGRDDRPGSRSDTYHVRNIRTGGDGERLIRVGFR